MKKKKWEEIEEKREKNKKKKRKSENDREKDGKKNWAKKSNGFEIHLFLKWKPTEKEIKWIWFL